ncbi:MAG: flagellar hook capping protein, partial [Lachnospiraceae bacterium]|nr:flagellar hook capping protein [Lachnospiraceae bacterium]
MSLVAPIVDGVLQTTTTSSESLSKTSENPNAVDSDMFLTLLVAEMQNQDPLEPTSNTEWVSQYATFTQVEQMNEVTASMDLVRANGLVGEEVIMKVTSQSTGETSYKRGVVDYVVVENGEPLLVIDENKYSIDDLDTIASGEYFDAYDKYSEFVTKMASLPEAEAV